MKSKSNRYKFARRSDGLRATRCKDVSTKSQRRPHKDITPGGMIQRRVYIPPEFELALMEMYPELSIATAIRTFIIQNVRPVSLKEDKDKN